MKFSVLILIMTAFRPSDLPAQKTAGQVFGDCEKEANRTIASYVGASYFEQHFRIDTNWRNVMTDTSTHYNIESLYGRIIDSVRCANRYFFAPDQIYQSVFLYLDQGAYGGMDISLEILDHLAGSSKTPFITDVRIEDLAKNELNLDPGEFEIKVIYYNPDTKKGSANSLELIQNKKANATGERLFIKIGEPDRSQKRINMHTEKVTLGKFILVDPYSGEIIDRGRRKTVTRGQYWWLR